jgi:hypothetical protein
MLLVGIATLVPHSDGEQLGQLNPAGSCSQHTRSCRDDATNYNFNWLVASMHEGESTLISPSQKAAARYSSDGTVLAVTPTYRGGDKCNFF